MIAPNAHFYQNGSVCGRCYEVLCIDDWHENTKNCCHENGGSITVQIVDQCPIDTNEEYCSGDEDHFDLSYDAFAALANPICGVISMQFRRVSCDFRTNIRIRNKDGINKWWYAIFVENVAGVGDLLKVELRDSSDDNLWHIGKTDKNSGTNFYIFEKKVSNGFTLPFDIRITNSNHQILTGWKKIKSIEPNVEFDFGSNFALQV